MPMCYNNTMSHDTTLALAAILCARIGCTTAPFSYSDLPGKISAAVDINTVANEVYKYNFSETKVMTRNIQSISPTEYSKMNINTILMSPPCQPFTRNGKYLDENDARTNSFIYLIGILNQLDSVEYILMENVKGFECSSVRSLFVNKLSECQFEYQEFLLCPSSVGVPNSRLRYYCIARRNKPSWDFRQKDIIMESLPKEYEKPFSLDKILEKCVPDRYLVPDRLLKRAYIFDICYRDSRRSCCFTKSYSHYMEGTGSVFSNNNPEIVEKVYTEANAFEGGSEEYVKTIKKLNLRFFTPKEILSIMSFPRTYEFPESVTIKQCYRLLGNSVNVKVISELLKLLFN